MNISIKQINQKSLALGKRGKSWAQDVHKHAMTDANSAAQTASDIFDKYLS